MRYLATAFAASALTAAVLTLTAPAHWKPGKHNARHAVVGAFCHSNNLSRPCHTGTQALRVSYCETGGTYSPWASNGQFKGIFQMGSSERERFGHGIDPWTQALAAHRYYALSGWSPWECAFLTGVL